MTQNICTKCGKQRKDLNEKHEYTPRRYCFMCGAIMIPDTIETTGAGREIKYVCLCGHTQGDII